MTKITPTTSIKSGTIVKVYGEVFTAIEHESIGDFALINSDFKLIKIEMDYDGIRLFMIWTDLENLRKILVRKGAELVEVTKC